MKFIKTFYHYIWIINTLRAFKGLTFEELNKKWQADGIADGNGLQRSSFNRHRDAILSMFGVIIDCDKKTYKYYISNKEALIDGSIEQWLFSTLTVHGVLSDSAAIKDRVVLENVPAGLEYLDVIFTAIKSNRRVRLGYQKFGTEGYEKTVCPYVLKLFHQRWYMLARTEDDQMRIYAFDRMTDVALTDKTFDMPSNFQPQEYFDEYFGVLTDKTPMAHVVVRTYGNTSNYLRTLPLHHSQHEIGSTEQYTDFAFDIRPTADFLAELLSHGNGIEVLEPAHVRQRMKEILSESLKKY